MNQTPQIELPFDPSMLLLEGIGGAMSMLSEMAVQMPWWFWVVLAAAALVRLMGSSKKHRHR